MKVAAIEDLIDLKRAAGRDKDRMDIEALERIQSGRLAARNDDD